LIEESTMSETPACLQRVKTCLGLGALVACFLLWSPGVSTVRAGDDSSPPQPQVTPKAAPPVPLAVVPARRNGQIEMAPRAPDPRAEATGDVIVLNTRGYNYGPDRPTVRPEAVHLPAAPADETQ
jgi:hypothetical protein